MSLLGLPVEGVPPSRDISRFESGLRGIPYVSRSAKEVTVGWVSVGAGRRVLSTSSGLKLVEVSMQARPKPVGEESPPTVIPSVARPRRASEESAWAPCIHTNGFFVARSRRACLPQAGSSE